MNIVIFGDSITWGGYDPLGGGWATLFRNYIEGKGVGIVYPLGICGDNTHKLLKRVVVEMESRKPDLVVFAIGVNDAMFIHSRNSVRVTLDDFQENLVKLLSEANKFTGKVAFVGLTLVDETKTSPCPWNTDKSCLNGNVKKYNDAIRLFCETNTLKYIPMLDVLETSDLDDGLHPNSKGHKKMFERVKSELLSLVAS
jgi:lysophospholipase L1-like esterase